MHKNKEEYKKEINSIDDIKCIIKGLCKDIDNVDKVYSSLSSFSFIIDDMIERPHVFLNSLFSEKSGEQQVVYPCSVVELRTILKSNKITNNNLLSLFSYSFAKKHLPEYSIFLVFSINNLKNYKNYCNMYMFDECFLPNIKDSIQCIVVNNFKSGQFTIARNILEDLKSDINIHAQNYIPVIENRKFAGTGSPNSYLSNPYDGYEDHDNVFNRMKGIKTVQYNNSGLFQIGDRVKLRNTGSIFINKIGRVIGFRDNYMLIEFDENGKNKIYKLDTSKNDDLSLKLQKID